MMIIIIDDDHNKERLILGEKIIDLKM